MKRSVLVVVALSCLFASADCSGRPAAERTIIRRTTPPIAASPTPLRRRGSGDLAPGAYVAIGFDPPFRFRVGAGWSTVILPPRFLSLSLSGSTEDSPKILTFQRLRTVVEPAESSLFTGRFIPPPKDVIGWLQDHPFMRVGTPSAIQVGGITGIQLDAVFTSAPKRYGAPGGDGRGCPSQCVIMWNTEKGADGYVFFLKGQAVRFIVIPVRGQDLVITIESLAADFDPVLADSSRVLATVSFVQ